MIICEVYYEVKPGMREALIEIARVNVEKTREEHGNLVYSHYPSMENETGMFVFEVWETAEDLEAHIHAKHYLEFSHQRKPMLVEGSYRYRNYSARQVAEGDSISTWS